MLHTACQSAIDAAQRERRPSRRRQKKAAPQGEPNVGFVQCLVGGHMGNDQPARRGFRLRLRSPPADVSGGRVGSLQASKSDRLLGYRYCLRCVPPYPDVDRTAESVAAFR